jgi:hypothetical protein
MGKVGGQIQGNVGQPILGCPLGPAGFQSASADHHNSRAILKSRLKGGCSQDWLPHKAG